MIAAFLAGLLTGVVGILIMGYCRHRKNQANEDPDLYQLVGPTGVRVVALDDETAELIAECDELRLRQFRGHLRAEIRLLQEAAIQDMARPNR